MKVTGLKATPVAVPLKEDPNRLLSVLVELSTDEGVEGIGESHAAVGVEATRRIVESARPLVLGEDPLNVEVLMKRLYAAFNLTHLHIHAANWALSGVDMALWDIVGKSCGKPLHKLWGGAFRRLIPYYGSLRRARPEDVALQAQALVKRGFKTLYLKVGFDPDEDVECVKAIREAVGYGKVRVRVDANQSWSPGEAIRIIDRMAKYDLEFVDQPILMYNLDAMARVRRAVRVPIASHESSWTFYNVLNIVKKDAADVIHVDPRFDAGFMGARISAGIAEAAGIPVVAHEWAMLGVSTCAYMQLIASCPNFIFANQTGYDSLADDVLKGGLMSFEDGCLRLPEAPGIGAELDQERVERYAKEYEEEVKGKGFEKDVPVYQLMGFRRYFGY